jgi:hypothetical protein
MAPTRRHIGDWPLGEGINSPSIQGDGVQFKSPLPILFDPSHGQSPYVSLQQPEITPYSFPVSPCQDRAAPIPNGLAPKVSRRASETQSGKRPNRGGAGSRKWPCPQDGCDNGYKRFPHLTRHIRDKHKARRKCPFCYVTWTRAEIIREHLRTKHHGRFTEGEELELLNLRGWANTIRFIAKCGMPRLPSNNVNGECIFVYRSPFSDRRHMRPLGGAFEPDDRNVT